MPSTLNFYHYTVGHTQDHKTITTILNEQDIDAADDEVATIMAEAAVAAHPPWEQGNVLAILTNESGLRIWEKLITT